MKRRLLLRTILPIALVIFLLDQASKIYIVHYLDLITIGRLEVLPPYLVFQMAWNTGINFGIPLGGPVMLVGLTLAISAALVLWVLHRRSWTMALGAGAVVGGALGNAIDRVLYGAVADFLNNSCCGFVNPYSYNIADVAIFAGAIWIAIKA
ncbi:MAG: signal peptidase II [Pseudomonadota bacterium]